MDHYTLLYDRDAFGRFWGYLHELDLELEAPNFEDLKLLATVTIQQTTGVNAPAIVYVHIGSL